MREFGKISTTVWRSKRFSKIKDGTYCTAIEVKALYCYLHTNVHGNSIGCYSLPLAYISHDMGMTGEAVTEALSILVNVGLIGYDPEIDDLVYIVDFLKHTPLTNPKHAFGALKIAMLLPDSELKPNVINDLCSGSHGEGLQAEIAKRYPNYSPMHSQAKAYAYTETDTEIETDTETDTDKVSGVAPKGASAKNEGKSISANWKPKKETVKKIMADRKVSEEAVLEEADEFRLYWLGEAGQRSRKKNWDIAFQRWCKKATFKAVNKTSSILDNMMNDEEDDE